MGPFWNKIPVLLERWLEAFNTKINGWCYLYYPVSLWSLWWNLIKFIPPTVEQLCTLFPSDEGLTIDLKNFRKPGEKTFTQRSRLFVGNLPPDITEEEMRKLFEKYGKAGEVFIHKDKGFGFIRLVSDLAPLGEFLWYWLTLEQCC